ncbi:cytochrome P450 [Mycena rebaudengoi]|nr:cytochrome P450 [Mycena rebaudengoi]
MDANPTSVYILLGNVVLFFLYAKLRRTRLPTPPGPKKLPLLGNLLSLPSHSEWETFSKWSKECHSDIIHISAAGSSIIVLSSVEVAEDLLQKRSAIYSDRPRLPMVTELLGGDFIFAFTRYGDTWRTRRRLFHKEFNPADAPRFRPQEIQHAHNLIRLLLDHPEEYAEHINHVIGASMMSIAYGLDTLPVNDPYLDAAREATRILANASVPGRLLVDTIPMLKHTPLWFPGAGFKRKAVEWKKLVLRMVDPPFLRAKCAMDNGIARPSFVTNSLRSLDVDKDRHSQEADIKNVAGTIYAGGTDTTRVSLLVFFLAMLNNPHVQQQAQKEIDEVVICGHLPDFGDEDALPYTTAIVKETLRWRPALPMGVPHFVAVEDEYRGYLIPAGSVVIANAWAMLHDEARYPDPEAFNPKRFLLDGKLNPAVSDPLDVAFGFGRRSCPGRYMAWDALWIMVASILAVFEITKAVDEDSRVIEPPAGHVSELSV